MAFIMYKLYFISPYPNPTPHTKHSAFLDFQKASFSMINTEIKKKKKGWRHTIFQKFGFCKYDYKLKITFYFNIKM